MNGAGFTKTENLWFGIKITFAMFAVIPCLADAIIALDAEMAIVYRSINGVSALFLFTFANWFMNQSVHLDQTRRWWREDAALKNAEIERLKRRIVELTEPEDDD